MSLHLHEPRVCEVVQAYLADLIRRVGADDLAPLTLKTYEKALRVGLMGHFAEHHLGGITAALALQMRDALRDQRGPAIANQAVQVSRYVYRYAWLIDMWRGVCPFAAVPRCPTADRREPVEPDNAVRVLRICRDALDAPGPISPVFAGYFLWLLLTGLRRSEGTSMRHADVDHRRRVVTIVRHKARKSGPKVLHLSDDALGLAEMIRRREWHPDWCFPSTRSASGHIEDPWHAWKALCRAASVPSTTRIHDIRHGFAEAAYEVSGDLKVVQGLLGHRSLQTTSRYVGRPRACVVRPVSNAVARLFRGVEGIGGGR